MEGSALIDLGDIGIYPAVSDSVLGTDPIGAEILQAMLNSFSTGVWGAVPENIWQANDDHVLMGGIVVGIYPLPDDMTMVLDLLAEATGSPHAPLVAVITLMGSGQTVILSTDELTERIEAWMEQEQED